MQKNSMLTLFFLVAITTFVMSQDKAHTPTSSDQTPHREYNFRSLELLIAENPFLIHHWNQTVGLNWKTEHADISVPLIESPSSRTIEIDNYKLLLRETEPSLHLRNVNDIEELTFTCILS